LRSQPESNFDFYDDWEDDENDALLAWGNEEYEQNNGMNRAQPTPHNTMNYGSGGDTKAGRARGKGTVLPYDEEADPTTIRKSSIFGFMERLPFKVGPRSLRYRPSAADLKDRSRGKKRLDPSADVLEEEEYTEQAAQPFKGRKRSTTQTSGHTIESLSSRGDIFPSDDEDDAIPLDDEFELGLERLERRNTDDDASSGRTPRSRRSANSQTTSRTHSARKLRRQNSAKSQPDSLQRSISSDSRIVVISSLSELLNEEHKLQQEEEDEIEKKRDAARKLALESGFGVKEETGHGDPESKEEAPAVSPLSEAEVNTAQAIELQSDFIALPNSLEEEEETTNEQYEPLLEHKPPSSASEHG